MGCAGGHGDRVFRIWVGNVEFFEMAPELAENAQVVGWVFERNLQNFHLNIRLSLGDGVRVFSLISAAFGVVDR